MLLKNFEILNFMGNPEKLISYKVLSFLLPREIGMQVTIKRYEKPEHFETPQ